MASAVDTPILTPTQTTPEEDSAEPRRVHGGNTHEEGDERSGYQEDEDVLGTVVSEGDRQEGSGRNSIAEVVSETQPVQTRSPTLAPTGAEAPTTGPEFWAIQRARWLQPAEPRSPSPASFKQPGSAETPSRPSTDPEPGSSRAKLESLLNVPGAEEDEQLWKNYLSSIHKNLVGGSRLRKGLKLSVVVKVLKAGWMRDGTWAAAAATSTPTPPATNPTTTAIVSSSFLPPSPYNFLKSAFRSTGSTPATSQSLITTQKSPPSAKRSLSAGRENQRQNSPPKGEDGGDGRELSPPRSSPPKGNWTVRIGRNIASGIVAKKKSIADSARRLSDELRRNSGGVGIPTNNNSNAPNENGNKKSPPPLSAPLQVEGAGT